MLAQTQTAASTEGSEHAHGSVYVPLDSWIYPALHRLAAIGYIPDQTSDLAPWTREECLRQISEAESLLAGPDAPKQRAYRGAQKLLSDLQGEFSHESTRPQVRVESLYTKVTGIAGTPVRDSYHLGQTIVDDLGRPYGSGFNNITGFSAYATAGRFSAYVRGEAQYAPGQSANPQSLQNFLNWTDGIPAASAKPIATTTRFEPLEMYAGVQIGPENITFGKQALWWGPGEDSSFAFSDNAVPFNMVRFDQTRPLILPGLLSHLGRIRTEILFGRLAGHQWPASPLVNAQKITLDLTDNLELGFTRSAFFAGAGRPLSVSVLGQSLFSMSSVDFGPYGSPDAPGDRHSGFDFRWRVPGLRKYMTLYSDSYADDEPNPIDNPRRSAWGPGIYLAQLPTLKGFDFRLETYATWLYRKDYGGQFLYWDNQYRDSYTNGGNLLGSWVGRDARAYVATGRYWLSAKTTFEGQFRQTKTGGAFLPGGGTQTDVSARAQWSPRPEWLIGAWLQGERYYIPLLGPARKDVAASLQLTFTPANWSLARVR